MSDDTLAVGGEIEVSKQLLSQSGFIKPLWLINEYFGPPPAPEELARRAERQAKAESKWDAKTAQGLVGVTDESDYEDSGPRWSVGERGGYVQRWVTPEVWQRYIDARRELDAAEEAFE